LLALVALSAAATTAAVSPDDNTSPLALGADISAAPADRCAGALLHFWPLDSKSGAADVAGGVHGVLHGDAASYEYGAPSSPDALSFDGKSTFADIPGLALSGPVSISLWARFNSPGLSRQYSYLFWFANELKQYGAPGLNPVTDAAGFVALSPHFETGWAALNWRLDEHPAQATLAGDASASLARGWHHWMLVLDAFNGTSSSTARLYIDGALAGSSDAFGPLTSSARAHLFLGRSGNVSPDAGAYGDPLFAGAMSHVRVLRGAMGAVEAAEMYRRPRDGGCEPPPPGMPPAGWAYAGCFTAPADDAASFPQLLGEGVSYDECFARAAKYDFTLAALQGVTAHGTPSSEWTAARCWGGMSGETPYDALGAAQCAPLAAALPGLGQQIVYRRVAPPTPAPGQPAPHGGPVIINVVVIAIKCSFTLCSVGSIVFAFSAAAREHIANRRNDASRAALAPALADDAAAAAAETGSSCAVAKPQQSLASGYYPPAPTSPLPSAPPMRPLPVQRGECAICLENPPDSVLMPCGHTYCSECSTALAEVPHAKCALCRSRIDSVQRIYL
jgi:cbb3-type cytochrome oxidase subunit 3